MKKQILLLLIIIVSTNLFAQHISEYYTFSQESSDYYYLLNPDGTWDTNSDGGEIPNVYIGFDFEYAGTTYSTLTIGVNGAVTFTGTDVFGGNDLAGTSTNVSGIIAPLWDDLYLRSADNGEIRWKLYGTAPNRSFSIEWQGISWWHAGSTVTFRLYLSESTNDIEFLYNYVVIEETGGEIGASIGLNDRANGYDFISVTPGNPATINTRTANNSIMPSEYNDYVAHHRYYFKYGPHNDACEDAIVIDPDGYTNTQIMNGTDNNDGFITPPGCGDGMNDGVWYTFTPDYNGEITIDVTAADFDVELGVYIGSCGSFTCVSNTDQTSNGTEQVNINVTAGAQYWINAGAYYSALDYQETGNLTINVNYLPPANDLCTDAIEINCSDTLDGTTIGATSSGSTNCGLFNNNKGVWYHFAPTNGGGVTAIWTTADFNAKLAIYSGSCSSLNCVANNDDTSGNQPYIEVETLPETDYYIYVAGSFELTGEFTLNISCTPPVNDEASGAIDVPVNAIGTSCTNPTILWNNNGVTDSSPINGTPSCASYAGGDSWYKFTAPASGGIQINRPNSGNWHALGYAIYDDPASDTALVCGAITDGQTVSNPFTQMNTGATYWLRVWEYNNNDFGSVGICLEEVDTAGYDDLEFFGFKYYPNPVTDTLYFSAQENIEQISIYNMLGQEVKNSFPLSTNLSLDISNLQTGTYFIKVQVGKQIGAYKIIKK